MGGRVEKALKKRVGREVHAPLAFSELIQPIGRGATMALKGSCGRPWA